jgi:hypothetical protein
LFSITETTNVLITCHTDQQNNAEQIKKNLINQRFSCYILNETTPQSIAARANLIRWCDVFIVIISRMYQGTSLCLEAIYYAKDVHRPIIAILAESNFQPYGGLGAISAGTIQSIVLGNDGISEKVIAQLTNAISARPSKKRDAKNIVDPAKV